MLIASVLNLFMIARLTSAKTLVARQSLLFAAISLPAILIGHFTFGVMRHIWPMIISLPLSGGATVMVILVFCRVFGLVDFDVIQRSRKATKNL